MSAPDSKCPTCGSGLIAVKSGNSGSKVPWILAGLAALAVVSGVLLSGMLGKSDKPEVAVPKPAAVATPAASPATPDSYALRLSGSNTIGSALAPRLVEAWLKSMGATEVSVQPRSKDGKAVPETVVRGQLAGKGVSVEVVAHGSDYAFKHLADGSADIGMASRPIKPEEAQSLSAMGNMTGRDSEHVVALDGIAVIVASGNIVASLSRQTLGRIFSGEITDWAQAGGRSGPIQVYARDEKSGTYDTFKTLVLHSNKLIASAKRYEDSGKLEADVAGDPNGIGFVGLPYVKSARALPVSDGNALALAPTVFTVKKEDYPLSRRLFLYTATNPSNSYVRQFTRFVQSEAGQQVVKAVGFVDQNLAISTASSVAPLSQSCTLSAQWPKSKDDYCKLITGKTDLGTNFRFQSGSSELDNRAAQDLQRLLKLMVDNSGRSLALVGFADSRGQYAANVGLATDRANAVRKALQTLGISNVETHGFGQEIPVADNDTSDGRERNRRVEVWVK